MNLFFEINRTKLKQNTETKPNQTAKTPPNPQQQQKPQPEINQLSCRATPPPSSYLHHTNTTQPTTTH